MCQQPMCDNPFALAKDKLEENQICFKKVKLIKKENIIRLKRCIHAENNMKNDIKACEKVHAKPILWVTKMQHKGQTFRFF